MFSDAEILVFLLSTTARYPPYSFLGMCQKTASSDSLLTHCGGLNDNIPID